MNIGKLIKQKAAVTKVLGNYKYKFIVVQLKRVEIKNQCINAIFSF